MRIPLLWLASLVSVSSFTAAATKTPLITEALTIDFSRSENLFDKKNLGMIEKLKKIAIAYAEEGTAYSRPLKYESLNYVLNPVLGSPKYQFYFRFNLKADDGKGFNCFGVSDSRFVSYSAGCYAAIP